MIKPQKKKKQYYNYSQCAEFVAYKLGMKDLRDVKGKFVDGFHPEREYLDFWHCLVDKNNITNPCLISINVQDYDWPDWAYKIAEMFEKQFGYDAEYWVEW